MSNINQNTIITLLEEVIPQMQSSDNAEVTLMKFAADKNLTPAVVERMCHAFNQLKTNCILDAADTMEKRGSSFSLIDGADFVKKYQDYAKNIDTDKMEESINAAKLAWGIPAEGSFSMKIASENPNHNKSSFRFVTDTMSKEYEKLNSLIEKEQEKLASEDTVKESKQHIIYNVLDAKRNLETLDEYECELFNKQASIEEKIYKSLISDNNKLASFYKDEADAMYIADKDISHGVNNLINNISKRNSFIADNIKRAADKGKKRLIKSASDISKLLIEYADNYENLLAVNTVRDDLKKEANSAIPEIDIEFLPEVKLSKKDALKLPKYLAEVAFTPTEFGKKVSDSVRDAQESASKGISNLIDFNKALIEKEKEAETVEHAYKHKALNDIFKSISDLNFQKLMTLDPVLSKLNDDEIENVTEAYLTYRTQYPELAFQPSLLKSILRSSAQIEGGEDLATAKSLIETRKSLADSRAKEKLL